MDIIPVLDILNNKVVKAVKGNRDVYQPINKQLYNTTDPRDIIYLIVKKFKPSIIYIADLNAIIDNNVSHELIELILKKFPKIQFWIDSGLNKIKFNKNGSIKVKKIKQNNNLKKLEKNLLLIYTSINRTAHEIASSYVNNLTKSKKKYS